MTHIYNSTHVRNLDLPHENYSIKNFLERDFPMNTISKKVVYKLGENREITVKVQSFFQDSQVTVSTSRLHAVSLGQMKILTQQENVIKDNATFVWKVMFITPKNCTKSQIFDACTLMKNFNQNNLFSLSLSTPMEKQGLSVKDSEGKNIPLSQISNLV